MNLSLTNVTSTLRLREYYYMALRHRLAFLVTIGVSLFLALILAFSLPKIYRAETVLLVEDEKILNPLISGLAISPSVASRMSTLKEELLSWQRLTLLVEKLKLDKGIKNPLQYERLIQELRKNISIKMKGTQLIIVGFEGRDPRKAQEIVQTLADIIIDGNLTSQRLEATSAISFIQKQLEQYRTKLEASEEELRKFQEVYNSTLPVATQMNEQLVSLKMELNNLLIENTELHPRVLETRKLIQQLEGQRDVQMQKAREQGVDIDPGEYAKLISSVPFQEQQLARLQRDYAVNDKIYQSLSQRLETAKISEMLEESDKGTKFKILEPARLPLEPVKPKKFLILLGGFIVGIALGCGLVYMLEFNDTSIRSVDEARLMLEFPILASIQPIQPEELFTEERLRRQVSV